MNWTTAIIWIAQFVGLAIAQVGIVKPPKDIVGGHVKDEVLMICVMNKTVPRCIWQRNNGTVQFKDSIRYRWKLSGSNTTDCSFFILCLHPIDSGLWKCSHEMIDTLPATATARITVVLSDPPENSSNLCISPKQHMRTNMMTDKSSPTVPLDTDERIIGLSKSIVMWIIVALTIVVVLVVSAITACCYFQKKAAILRSHDAALVQCTRNQNKSSHELSMLQDNPIRMEMVDSMGYLKPKVSRPNFEDFTMVENKGLKLVTPKDKPNPFMNVSNASYHTYEEINEN